MNTCEDCIYAVICDGETNDFATCGNVNSPHYDEVVDVDDGCAEYED